MLYILISETGIINMLVPGRLAVVGIISIVFAAIAGIILAGKISVPVKAATRAAKDIARGIIITELILIYVQWNYQSLEMLLIIWQKVLIIRKC